MTPKHFIIERPPLSMVTPVQKGLRHARQSKFVMENEWDIPTNNPPTSVRHRCAQTQPIDEAELPPFSTL